jgi:hypothetical protein
MAHKFALYAVYHGLRGKGHAAFDASDRFGFMEHLRGFNDVRVAEDPGQQVHRPFGACFSTQAALKASGFEKFEPRQIPVGE